MSHPVSPLPIIVTAPHVAEVRKAELLDDVGRQNLDLADRGYRDAKARIRSRYDELEDLRHKRDSDQVRASSLDRDRANGIKFSNADVAAQDRLKESIQAQTAKIKKLAEIRPDPVLDPSDIESDLASVPTDTKLRPCPVAVVLKKGQDEFDALQETRSEIAALAEKREKTLRAPLTTEEAIEAAVADIRRREARGAPKLSGCRRFTQTRTGRWIQGGPAWPQTNIVNDEFAKQAQAGIDFICYLFPAEVEERIVSEIRAQKYPNALSREARFALLAEIDAAILEAERREVELCRRLMLAGDSRVAFRPGLNWLAVCAVEIVGEDDGEETNEADDFDFEGDAED